MDGEIVIKEEPLDYDESEYNGSDYTPIDQCIKVEFKNDNYGNYTGNAPSSSSSADERLSILAEKSNLITVCVTDSIKIEDELNIIGQFMPEEEHAYARMEYDSQPIIGVNCSKPSSKKNLTRNGEKKPNQIECRRNCGRKFRTLTERAMHESYDHETKMRTIKCNFCNKHFDSFFALTRHMPEHRNVQRYVCTHCSKSFESYQLLQFHWKTSAGCSSEELPTKNQLSEGPCEEKEISSKSKKSRSKKKANSSIKRIEASSSNQPTLMAQNETNLKTSSHIELPPIPALPKKDLSFAEEIKAFAAKYQLKGNLVAKKRTSPMVILPDNTKKRKKSKATLLEKCETVSQYVIPNAIGASNSGISNPILNIKIKEEPIDQYDEQFFDKSNPSIDQIEIQCDPFCDIQVKNEPLDDEPPHEETIDSNIDQNKMENKSVYISTPSSAAMPLESTHTSQSFDEQMKCFKIMKIPKSNSKSFDSETSPTVEATNVNGRILDTSAGRVKNIKLLKLAPNLKVIKLSKMKVTPMKSRDESCEASTNANDQSDLIPKFLPIKLQFSSDKMKSSVPPNNTTVSIETEATVKQEMKEETAVLKKRHCNTLPKTLLRSIESQPQTMKIIEDLQRKIVEAENTNAIILPVPENTEMKLTENNNKVECSNEKIVISNTEHSPPSSLYLSVTDDSHPELSTARRKYRNYRFSWICPHCPTRYDHKDAFLAHLIRIHEMCRDEFDKLVMEVRPFQLDEPKKIFKLEINQQNNGQIEENGEKTEPEFLSYSKFRCPHCLRTCSSRTMLNDHIAGNCGREPMFKCSECPKAFFSAHTLHSHKSVHTGELPHKCDYCDKHFRTPGQVRVHHRSHTGERPFACEICNQRFAHRETLISHLSRHIGMKRYRCYACGKQFSCVSGLKAHHEQRQDTCGRVRLNTRAVGPRVRVIRGQVHFEPQPEINLYLRTEDPQDILTEIQNIPKTSS